MGRVVQASLAAVSLLTPARLSVRLRLVSVLRSTRGTLLDMDMKQDGPRQEVAAGKQMGTERLVAGSAARPLAIWLGARSRTSSAAG